MWICYNVRCNAQELPAFICMEFESLVWGHAGTEPGKAGQSPSFDLQEKNYLDSHNPTFRVLF